MHLNNDSPGTDNGLAVGYGPGIRVGVRVRAGTLVGYVGDSGNSEETTPHLHFELHQPDGYRANPYPALRKARRVSEPYVLNSVDYDQVGAWNAELVAHLDPGHGFNADLDVVDGYAFMGTWGVPERCPGNGVKVMDVRDPSRPESLGSIADHHYFPGTSTASLWVGNVFTPHFQGRLGVIGLAACDPVSDPADDNQLIGFATYDLTDPANPALLDVERIDTPGSGVHSLDVSLADGQIVLAALVPEPRPPAMSTRNTILLFDLSDPQSPTFLSRWQENSWQPGPVLEAPYPHLDDQVQWLGPGTLAAGLGGGDLVVLDITDVSDPKESWRIAPLSAENYAPLDLQPGVAFAGRYLMVEERPNVESDEDPRGRLLAFDFSRQEDPSPSFTYTWEIGNDTESPAFPGFFLPHRSVLYNADDIVVASMSGGVRVVGLDDAGEPVERAYLVPAPTFDPQRWWVGPDGSTDFPMVWDVETENGYVYASDHNSGLWIFRLTFPIDAVDGSNQSE